MEGLVGLGLASTLSAGPLSSEYLGGQSLVWSWIPYALGSDCT